MGLGRVNTFMTKMIFRTTLLKRAYTKKEFEQFLAKTKLAL